MRENIYIKKITALRELDDILPMLESFHKTQKYCELFPHSGYLAWLTSSFMYLGVFVAYEKVHHAVKDIPVGYAIVCMNFLNTTKEALIYEVYSEIKYLDITKEAFGMIEDWARERECELISCYTERQEVVDVCTRRYGFEPIRTHLAKRLR
jgi:hypothetical protein